MFILKKSRLNRWILLVVCLVGYACNVSSDAQPLPDSGVITAVYDGDTVKVRFEDGTERRVRLIGVDAPETGDSREAVSLLALMAKRFAFCHLYSKEVKLSYDWQLEDKYGRVLAYVWTKEQDLFNEFIIRQGFAYAYRQFPYRKDFQESFQEAQREAQRLQRGFWKKNDYPLIQAQDCRPYLGSILSVQFTCLSVELKKPYVFLHSTGGDFQALIPQEYMSLFPDVYTFREKTLIIAGYLEDYNGIPQMFLFYPRQLQDAGQVRQRRKGFPG